MSLDPQRLRELTTPEWTAEREDAILRRLDGAPSRPAMHWVVAAAAVVIVGLTALVALDRATPSVSAPAVASDAAGQRPEAAPVVSPTPQQPSPPTPAVLPLEFRDGTSVVPHDPDSEVVIALADATHTTVQLRRGGARFDVTPNQRRRFEVDAGLVNVTVLGTEFDCTRTGDRVAVEVIRGRVAVSWPGGSRELTRGEKAVFPPEPEPEPEPAIAAPHSTTSPAWRRLAKEGKTDKAFDALRRGAKVASHTEELMLAADVARKAGHPAAALPYLRRVVKEHPKDSRAPLAAFTTGRIESERGRFAVAAQQFATAGDLGGGSLREHALAREAEAWAAAGKETKARRRAQKYLVLHPTGPRAPKIRQLLTELGP